MKKIQRSVVGLSATVLAVSIGCAVTDYSALETLSAGLETLVRHAPVLQARPRPRAPRQVRRAMRQGDFIRDILGMPEKQFRDSFDWNERSRKFTKDLDILTTGSPQNKTWVKAYPRRKALFAGRPEFMSIRDLDKAITKTKKLGTPSFRILIYDPKNRRATDIRALQADPVNKNAVFQIASTPFAVEGGMTRGDAYLENMLHSPVQGEFASKSAAGAAIDRKYIRPTFRAMRDPYDYLFYFLERDNIAKRRKGSRSQIDLSSVDRYRYDAKDLEKVAVVIHGDVYVTSGYYVDEKGVAERLERLRKAKRKTEGFEKDVLVERLSLDEDQRITQIFTTAYDTRFARKEESKGRAQKHWRNFAQLALNGSYVATLMAAYLKNKQRVILTLMGGGSFRNNIAWIQEAIEKIIPLIKKYGLDVTLVFYPDKYRTFYPVRTAAGDKKFLKDIAPEVAAINRKPLPPNFDALVDEYVEAAYARPRNADLMSQAAKQLNGALS